MTDDFTAWYQSLATVGFFDAKLHRSLFLEYSHQWPHLVSSTKHWVPKKKNEKFVNEL